MINEKLILEYLQKCKEIDFPQTVLSNQSIRANYRNLCLKENSSLSSCCMQLIQHFHPSIWECSVKGYLSPKEAWQDELLLYEAIRNRLKYKGEELSPKDIRAGFNLSKKAPKISIFNPSLAKYIIKKYLNEFNTIFDPCSGYSGRMLGTCCLNKKYIGQDINDITVEESNNLMSYLNLNAEVICKNSLCSKGKYDCLITCPPYSDKENWNQDIETLNCDEWIEVCLNNFKCQRYVFVVGKTEKYKQYTKEKIEHKSYLTTIKEYVVVI